MAQPTYLHAQGSPLRQAETPESYLISAWLDTGKIDLASHHLADAEPIAHEQVWSFILDYQASAGSTPPVEMVLNRFPTFVYTPGVSLTWAVANFHRAAYFRGVRIKLNKAITAMREDDLDGVSEVIKSLQDRPRGQALPYTSGFDLDGLTDPLEGAVALPVPYPTLGRATGGIKPSDLWFLGGRPGLGKSWQAVIFGAEVLEHGEDVHFLSCEMPRHEIAERFHWRLARKDNKLRAKLRGSRSERIEAVAKIADMTPGQLHITDAGHTQIGVQTVQEAAGAAQMVVVDHVGLLRSTDGRRGIEDWRVAALIADELREVSLSTTCPILSLVQINRGGEGPRPPRLADLSQTDWIAQAATVVVTMADPSAKVRAFAARKVRNGPQGQWFARYDVEHNRFEEISKEVANDQMMIDADNE